MTVAIDMSGQVGLITGAAQGIGLETASLFCQAGASVMIADLNGDAAEQAADKLRADGYSAGAVQCNVAEPAQAGAAVAATLEKFGKIDVLVNNAAAWTVKFFVKQTFDDYKRDVDVCLIGTMNMCHAAIGTMMESGSGGAIVNLISDAGRVGEPRLVAYSGAKGGVVGFTKGLAKEAARYKIRVNGVSPGTTHTPGSDDVVNKWGGEEKVVPAYPLGRLGEPCDQGYAILFLSSPWSTWITGQILSVNGGYAMPD
jgi:NAD(P)-dependent dehydrogenase (short-subunit alcohol dehydrogenase family)